VYRHSGEAEIPDASAGSATVKSGDDGGEHTYMGYVTHFSAPSIALDLKEEHTNVEYDIGWGSNRHG
jgi:hypothetical protein